MTTREDGVPLGGGGASIVGPFIAPGVAPGNAPDPADSEPAYLPYGGADGGGGWVACYPYRITALSVMLAAGSVAAGSALRALVIVSGAGGPVVHSTLVAMMAEGVGIAHATGGAIDVAPGEAVLVAVQVGDAWTTTGIAISASLSVEARS